MLVDKTLQSVLIAFARPTWFGLLKFLFSRNLNSLAISLQSPRTPSPPLVLDCFRLDARRHPVLIHIPTQHDARYRLIEGFDGVLSALEGCRNPLR